MLDKITKAFKTLPIYDKTTEAKAFSEHQEDDTHYNDYWKCDICGTHVDGGNLFIPFMCCCARHFTELYMHLSNRIDDILKEETDNRYVYDVDLRDHIRHYRNTIDREHYALRGNLATLKQALRMVRDRDYQIFVEPFLLHNLSGDILLDSTNETSFISLNVNPLTRGMLVLLINTGWTPVGDGGLVNGFRTILEITPELTDEETELMHSIYNKKIEEANRT